MQTQDLVTKLFAPLLMANELDPSLESNLSNCLWVLKALLVRGDNEAYGSTVTLFERHQSSPSFMHLFVQIILKYQPDLDSKVTASKGFKVVSKVYRQRLFTLLYPVFQMQCFNGSDTAMASQLMMHLCSTVSLQLLQSQNKLNELVPMALDSLRVNS